MIRNIVIVSEYCMWRRLFLFSCLSRTQYTLYARTNNTRVLVRWLWNNFGYGAIFSRYTYSCVHFTTYVCVWLWMSGLSWTSELFKYSFMRIKSCYTATYMKMIGMRLIYIYSEWEMDRNKDIAIWHKDGTWINETFNHFKLNLIVYGIDILDQFY